MARVARTAFDVPPLIGDAFYLLAHDHVSGRSLLDVSLTQTAMGAAMLAEMVFARLVHIDAGVVVPVPSGVLLAPEDLVQHRVLAEIRSERDLLPVEAWIRGLGPLVVTAVAERLERGGYHQARPVTHRALLGRFYVGSVRRWRPASPLRAEAPKLHLRNLLYQELPFHPADLTLAGLVFATGLQQQVFQDFEPSQLHRLRQDASLRLAAPLPELIARVESTVGRLVAVARH
jgi:hypothetical protein